MGRLRRRISRGANINTGFPKGGIIINLDLNRLTKHDARTLLNDEIAFRQFAGLHKIEPGILLGSLMTKFPRTPINTKLYRYLKRFTDI